MKTTRLLALIVAIALPSAFAQSVWNSSSSSDWTDTGNWTPADPDYPGSGSLVGTNVTVGNVVPPSSQLILSGYTEIGSLDFANTSTENFSFEFDGSPGTSLQVNGGITNGGNGTSTPTFNLDVAVGADSTFAGGTGALVFSNVLNVGLNTLTTSGAVNIGSFGQLTFAIGDSVSDPYGHIEGNSINISSGGVVTIAITGAYTGNLGDVFSFNTSGFTNAALGILPTLSGGLGWDSSSFLTNGQLTVVAIPEPSTWLLFLGGFAVCCFLRRRTSAAVA